MPLRTEQLARHLRDLATATYEGRSQRPARFELFVEGVEWATPVAFAVLEEINRLLLAGSGMVGRDPLPDEGTGRDACRWFLEWPEQQRSVSRITGEPLEPIVVAVAFPADYTHPHLGEAMPVDSPTIWAWPFQVASADDAEGLRPILEAIAEASLHERIFQADVGWRVIPVSHESILGPAGDGAVP